MLGKDNSKEQLHEISRNVGILFQDPEKQFFALTVRDELAFALESRGVPPQEIEQRIWFEAKRFKLKHLMEATVFNLSEGEKQRVAVGAILAQEPRMFVLDEPSANLDPKLPRSSA